MSTSATAKAWSICSGTPSGRHSRWSTCLERRTAAWCFLCAAHSSTAARMVALGFSEALLWVLVGNARAQRIYQIDGWRPDGAQDRHRLGVAADEVRYRRSLPSGGGMA